MKKALMVAVLLTLVGTLRVTGQETVDAERFSSIAKRFHLVLERRPRKGATFDLLYRHYLDAGKLDELETHYEQLAKQQPNHAATQLVLGLVYERRGRPAEALVSIQKAAKLAEDDAYPEHAAAMLLVRQYRHDEAIEALQRALKKKPERTHLLDIYKQLGRLQLSQGQPKQALATWSKLAVSFPDDRRVLQELAELLTEEEQFDEAIKHFQQLIKLAKSDLYQQLTARVEIGQIQVRQGKLKTAITTFESCLKEVKPDSWIAKDLRRRIEDIFLRGDDLAGLVQYYEKRLEQHPDDLESMTQLAAAMAKLGRNDEAEKQYLAVLKLAPSRDDIRVILIEELARREKFKAAIHQAETLVNQQPDDAEHLSRLGRLYLRAAADDRTAAETQALATWEKISQLRPDDPMAAVQVAELCRQSADIRSVLTESSSKDANKRQAETVLGKAVLNYYREAVQRGKGAEQYQEYLGEYLYSIGRTDEAMTAWRRIAEPPRETTDNLKRLAQILAGAEQLDEAIITIQKAIEKEQDRYDLHDLAADLFAKRGDLNEALKQIDAMEQLANSPQLAEQALTRRVEIYMSAGRLSEESQKLTARLADPALKPTTRDYWLAGKMAAAERRSAAALAHLEQAIKLAPDDARLLRFKAEVHQQGGDLSGATEQFRQLAKLEPSNRATHLRQVVQLELELGRLDSARETAEEIVRLMPGNSADMQLLAKVHFQAGEDEKGLETFRQAVRIDPRDTTVRLDLARQLISRQQINEAIEHLWRVFELLDSSEEKLSIIGELSEQYIVTDQMTQLTDRLERMRREQEDPFAPTLYLAQAHIRAEDYAGARRELNALLARRPDDVRVIAQLVALSEKLGDSAQAAQYQEKLVELDKQASSQEHLAQLYSELGRDDEAEAIWQRIILESPDEKMLISAIDRAIQRQNFKQAMSLAGTKWAKSPDDWRFGSRLVLASWQAKQRDRATDVAHAILKLIPSDKYKPLKTGQSAQTQQVASQMSRYPALFMRISLPMQIRSALAGTNNFGFGMMGWKPRELLDAQMLCSLVLYEAARRKKNQEQHLSQLKEQSKTDLNALRRVVWLLLSEQKVDELNPLLERWINRSPMDAEPRIALFVGPFLRGNPNNVPNATDHLETMRTQYEWLVANQPSLARFMTAPYAQLMMSMGQKDEAAKLMRSAIEQARDTFELRQIGYMVMQIQDFDLLSLLITRMETLRGRSHSGNYGYLDRQRLMESYSQLAAQKKQWDKLIDSFERYMAATHPKRIQTDRRITASTATLRNRRLGRRQKSNPLGTFPGPSAWLDESRLPMLLSVHKALRAAGEVARLRSLIDRYLKETEGIPQQCWQLSSIVLLWLEDDREEAIEQLEQFSANFPDNIETRMLIARAHSQTGAADKALAAIDGLHLPFGSLSKSLEQLRLELAQQINNDEVGKQAALRLFGMRLSSSEQAELAKTMRRLGLAARSDELIRRAVRTASNKPSELLQLMQQHSQSNPKRAAEVARMIIRQVSRDSSRSNSNSNYRSQAFRVLKRNGDLVEMIKKTEQQLAAAPQSVKLMEDLAELYEADGDESKASEMIDRIIKVRPDDARLHYRIAQSYFKRNQHAKGIKQLEAVWKNNPELVLKNSYQIGDYYARAKNLDLLAKHIAELKDQPVLTQQSYQISNLVQNLQHKSNDIEGIIKVYRAALGIIPPQRRWNMVRKFGELLVEKKRKPDAYLLYKEHLFPDEEDGQSVSRVSQGTHYVNGSIITAPIQLADLAAELKKSDELAQEIAQIITNNDDQKPLGELLIVMFKRRADEEKPITEFARRYIEDKKFAKLLGRHFQSLREELTICKSEPALRAAIDVWALPPQHGQAIYAYSSSSSDQIRIAAIHIKLKQREQARDVLLKSLASQPSQHHIGSPGEEIEMELQRKLPVAEALQKHGFHLDAAVVYHAILKRLPELKSDSNFRRFQATQAARSMQQSVATLLGDGSNEALATLRTTLKDNPEGLAQFFVIADPPVNDDPYRGSRKRTKTKASANAKSQLLTGLLLHAQQKGQLAEITQLVDTQIKTLGNDVEPAVLNRWTALQILATLFGDKPSAANEPLLNWLGQVEQKKKLGANGKTWLLALAALEFEPTREAGIALASKVAQQAALSGNSARQQAAIAAINARDGKKAEEIINQLIAGKQKGDPQTLFQIAQIHYQRKQYAKAVAALDVVWDRSPELLMPKIRQLTDYYVKAEKIDALAKSIRTVRDQNLWNQYGYELPNAMNSLPANHKLAQQVVELYFAITETSPQNNGDYHTHQLIQYLRKLPKDEKKLAIYRQVVFPTKKRDGEVAAFAQTYADLAKAIDRIAESEAACRKAMKEHPRFQAKGEMLLAIFQLREGNEEPMMALAEKYRKDSSFAAQLTNEQRVLHREFAKCKGGIATEIALEAYRKQAVMESGQSTYATRQVASLLVKLGDREAARRALLEVLERLISLNYQTSEENLLQMKLQRHQSLAREFSRHGFLREAVAAHAKVNAMDTAKLKANSYVFSMIRQSQQSARQLIVKIVDEDKDQTLSELEKAVGGDDKQPELNSFFLVFDQASTGQFSDGKSSKADAILPAVLAHAKKTDRLQALRESVKHARKRHPTNLQLVSLDVLCAATAEQMGETTADVQHLADRATASPQTINDSTWLVARAAIESETTRELGRTLAEAVAQQAGKTGNRSRQTAAVTALTVSLTKEGQDEKAAELMHRLIGGDQKSPEAQLQTAQILFQQQRGAEAVKILESVWKERPELLLPKYEQIANLYIEAGSTKQLAEALGTIDDEKLRRRYRYEVVNAAQKINRNKKNPQLEADLLAAAVVFSKNDSYSVSQLARHYSNRGKESEAWQVYQQGVIPPTGLETRLPSFTGKFAEMTVKLKKTEELQETLRKAVKSHPQWLGCADLLLAALLHRVDKSEERFIALVEKYRQDPVYSKSLNQSSYVLRSELFRCQSPTVLELARELWQAEVERLHAQDHSNPGDYEANDSLAQVLLKLDRRDEARRTLLAALAEPISTHNSGNQMYHLFQRREQLATTFQSAGFHLDAMRLWQKNLKVNNQTVKRHRLKPRQQSQQRLMRKSLHAVLTGGLDEAVSQLEKTLTSSPNEIESFFAIASPPWTYLEFNKIPEHVRAEAPQLTQLLPALLQHASRGGRLDQLGKVLAKARKAEPENEKLAALQTLFDQTGNGEISLPRLTTLSQSSDPNLRALAVINLAHFKQPEATAAIVAATTDRDSKWLVIDALGWQDTPQAAQHLGKMFDSTDVEVRFHVVRALQRMHSPEADKLARFERVAFDNFEGSTSLDWQILNPEPIAISFDTQPGTLTIKPHRDGPEKHQTHQNKYSVPLPEGCKDFQITIGVVGFKPHPQSEEASLFAAIDEDNYVSSVYGASNKGRVQLNTYVVAKGARAVRKPNSLSDSPERFWWRLTKIGNQYAIATSTDGKQFTTHGQVRAGSQPKSVGFNVNAPADPLLKENGISFDFFELCQLVGTAVEKARENNGRP